MSLDTVVAESDVVTVHTPLTQKGRHPTHHLFDTHRLQEMKSDAWLINTSRGFVVHARDLATWAGDHPEARVVLDVHDPEPPPPDYPLWDRPNVRLLPHLASRTDQALLNMSWVVRDVAAVLAKYPLREKCTLAVGPLETFGSANGG